MIANNAVANNSAGTQINRYLDALGYPDSFGDAIGALVDAKSGNISGAFRNLVDMQSGMTTRQTDAIFGGPQSNFFRPGFVARNSFAGPHLVAHRHTYAVREQVGKRAHVGQRYGFNWGPFKSTGRISGMQYAGSFAKPMRLANGDYLYRGRTYDNLHAIARDARDGRVDGQATTYRTRTTWRPAIRPFPFQFGPGFGGIVGAGNVLGNILDQLGKFFGGGQVGGGNTNTGGTGGTGSTGGSVLDNPNMTIEDKLALLMSKLSSHLDKQIEDKMKGIESAMQQQDKKGGASSAANGGEKKPNLQLLQTQLQQILQKRQQMFQTMSSILKSLHDTSMNAIRNLKA